MFDLESALLDFLMCLGVFSDFEVTEEESDTTLFVRVAAELSKKLVDWRRTEREAFEEDDSQRSLISGKSLVVISS